jgi:hypothetical protein
MYPHQHTHAGSLWFSRIEDTNPPVRQYEAAHGYWIPGNARDALVAIFRFVHPDQVEDFLRSALGVS